MGRIAVGGQPGQTVTETPIQPITGHCGTHFSSQLLRRPKEENLNPDLPSKITKTYLNNNSELGMWLKW
jgi:hypothetical protein